MKVYSRSRKVLTLSSFIYIPMYMKTESIQSDHQCMHRTLMPVCRRIDHFFLDQVTQTIFTFYWKIRFWLPSWNWLWTEWLSSHQGKGWCIQLKHQLKLGTEPFHLCRQAKKSLKTSFYQIVIYGINFEIYVLLYLAMFNLEQAKQCKLRRSTNFQWILSRLLHK